jgi:uncharacterized membrane-anchored protein
MTWGLVVGYWMSRAPKSLLQLLGLGTETGHKWLVSLVRWFGILMFFALVSCMLSYLTPSSVEQAVPGFSLLVFGAAIAISVFALKKPKKA